VTVVARNQNTVDFARSIKLESRVNAVFQHP
jgi:hypothetical protein